MYLIVRLISTRTELLLNKISLFINKYIILYAKELFISKTQFPSYSISSKYLQSIIILNGHNKQTTVP